MENLRIRRVPIEAVLDILHELYDRGVDFVDFHGRIEDGEDVLGISFVQEYMDPEYAEEYPNIIEEDVPPNDINVKLSDDDLEELA